MTKQKYLVHFLCLLICHAWTESILNTTMVNNTCSVATPHLLGVLSDSPSLCLQLSLFLGLLLPLYIYWNSLILLESLQTSPLIFNLPDLPCRLINLQNHFRIFYPEDISTLYHVAVEHHTIF